MKYMFIEASALNQNIGSWNTAQVTDMSYIFFPDEASAFDQDIGSWNTAQVTNVSDIIYYYYGWLLQVALDRGPLESWHVHRGTYACLRDTWPRLLAYTPQCICQLWKTRGRREEDTKS